MVYNYLLLTLICNLKEEIYCTPSEVFQQRSMFMVYNRIADSVTLRFFISATKPNCKQPSLICYTAYTAEDANLSLARVN